MMLGIGVWIRSIRANSLGNPKVFQKRGSSRGGMVAVRKISWTPTLLITLPIVKSFGWKSYEESRIVWALLKTIRSRRCCVIIRYTKAENPVVWKVLGVIKTSGANWASLSDQ